MNSTDETDNEDVFHLDMNTSKSADGPLVFPSRHYSPHPNPHQAQDPYYIMRDSDRLDSYRNDVLDMDIKGKHVSQPMLIRRATNPRQHDLFALSLESGFASGSSPQSDSNAPLLSPSSFASSSADVFSIQTPSSPFGREHIMFNTSVPLDEPPRSESNRKGKGRAAEFTSSTPPILPPLQFSPTLSTGEEWPEFMRSSTPGPSSYTSAFSMSYGSPTHMVSSNSPPETGPLSDEVLPAVRRIPSRRRSFSNLSIHSTPSVAARVKFRFQSGSPSNIARKLLFRKRADTLESPSRSATPPSEVVDTDLPGSPSVGQGSCFLPGCGDMKNIVQDDSTIPPNPPLDFSQVASLYAEPTYPVGRPTDAAILKGKGRSYSSPFPLTTSPFDIISSPELNVFSPIRVEVRDFFDEILPREIQLQIFSALLAVHEADFCRLVAGDTWTALKASSTKNRWVGRHRGIRELIKMGRVSKAWRSLVFDGQLWREFDLSAFPKLPTSVLTHIAGSAGAFVTRMNMVGHARLQPGTLLDISDDLCLDVPFMETLAHTQLTYINLQGCFTLTTRSLHHLLVRSPLLEKLAVKGLKAVSNTTCDVLSVYCRRLVSLDMSRCMNLDGEGIRHMASATLTRGDVLLLQELRLSGLRKVTNEVLSVLGQAAPYLEVLDLSYVTSLHNSAINAFVECSDDYDFETILLTSREAGRDPGDDTKYRKRVTRLRHLSLAYCSLLTDIAASHLAHTVPKLEFLEMGGIGSELKDEGLVRLFETTPYIRRLDLEDASDISNDVIQALTPSTESSFPQAGHALEHLVVSYAMGITNDAFLALIKGCNQLKVLEADSTRLSGNVAKEFVKLCHQREISDAKLVAVDCRNVGDSAMKEMDSLVRPRLGWRAYDAKKLAYLDGRDEEELNVGQDECDEKRVVVKTFYSWQIVDSVKTARAKKLKERKNTRRSATLGGIVDDLELNSSERGRWWGGRRLPAGTNTPTLLDTNASSRDGCIIM